MPVRKFCSYPGCSCLVRPGEKYCDKHRPEEKEKKPFVGGWMTDVQKAFYNSQRWRKEKSDFLKSNPDCSVCGRQATDVHHQWPDGYDYHNAEDFWDQGHWVPLCSECHDQITKEAMDRRRKLSAKNRREKKLWY